MNKRALWAGCVVLACIFSACGNDATIDSADTTTTTVGREDDTTTTAADDGGDTTTTAAEGGGDGELPQFLSDFSRVCTTQVGFGGATAYSETPGLHPVALFEERDEKGSYLESSEEFPEGWTVDEDLDYEDNSELAAIELVACATRTDETPNGTDCELDNDGETITLELVDAVYELVVYSAATGDEQGTATLEAASTDCPFFVLLDEGQTQYINTPSVDDYTNALKPFVDK